MKDDARTSANILINPAPKELRFTYASEGFSPLRRLFIRAVEKASGQGRLKRRYNREIMTGLEHGACFFESALDALRLDVAVDDQQMAKILSVGPVLFVANHPYGVLDGIILTALAKRVRPDVKVLAHKALCQVPASRANLLPIDFDPSRDAALVSAASRRAARRWLQQGGAIGIFPGGGIATSLRAGKGHAYDLPWHPFAGQLAQTAGTTVIPVYFEGQNSQLFQRASHISSTLRLSLIFRETARRIGSTVDVQVGDPVTADELSAIKCKSDLVRDLRARTVALSRNGSDGNGRVIDPSVAFHLSP